MNPFNFSKLLPAGCLIPLLLLSCTSQTVPATLAAGNPHAGVTGDTVQEMADDLWIMMQDSRGDYWFGSVTKGLFKYIPGPQNTIIHYTTQHGLPHNRINQIQEDHLGNIFLNTSEGICKFDGAKFTTLQPVKNLNGVAQWKLEKNDLWFGGIPAKKNVYRYDGSVLHELTLPDNDLAKPFLEKYPDLPYGPYDIYSMYKDRNGFIWFGTANLGACRYDGSSFAWISDEEVTDLDDGPSCGVRAFYEDDDGLIWIGSTLNRYEVFPQGTLYGIQYLIEKKKGLDESLIPSQKEVTCFLSIMGGDKGEIWFTTYDDGVWKYNGKTVVHYPVMDNDTLVTTYSMYRDRSGMIWLGTHDHGVFQFTGERFERFRPM